MVIDSLKLEQFEKIKSSKEVACFLLSTEEKIFGRVISIHSDYLVVAVVNDFHFDGFAYVLFNSIGKIEKNESNEFYSKLFNDFCHDDPKAEELPNKYFSLLDFAIKSKKLFIFELEDELHLGKVKDVNKMNICIDPLSSTGEFMGEFEIPLSDVLFIRDGSEYIKAYSFFCGKNRL